MSVNFRNFDKEELFDKYVNNQQGIGCVGAGYTPAGKYLLGVVQFFLPMKSIPELTISNIEYTNCSNGAVVKVTKYGFAVRATVTTAGLAYATFNWEAVAV